ncbi:hypothetical protein DENSPDRAFT_411783 [Dentipellis sp. KUC8613]|nr:hypothetical protein DENSPDRAFT_411783 [Dentipellis sp. KUC8613]
MAMIEEPHPSHRTSMGADAIPDPIVPMQAAANHGRSTVQLCTLSCRDLYSAKAGYRPTSLACLGHRFRHLWISYLATPRARPYLVTPPSDMRFQRARIPSFQIGQRGMHESSVENVTPPAIITGWRTFSRPISRCPRNINQSKTDGSSSTADQPSLEPLQGQQLHYCIALFLRNCNSTISFQTF